MQNWGMTLILISFDFLLDLLLSCRESSLSVVSVSITLGSTLWEDWQTKHGKFINCKLFVTNSVDVHKI